jgi:hypothetical protein
MTLGVLDTKGVSLMDNDDSSFTDLESDPSSLASQTAVELDNLLRGRTHCVRAVSRLAELIQEEFSETARGAPTVGAMKRAIVASSFSHSPLTRVEEVQNEAAQVVDLLNSIASDPEGYRDQHSDSITRMRAFCVAFSIQRSATDYPRGVRCPTVRHPVRRGIVGRYRIV